MKTLTGHTDFEHLRYYNFRFQKNEQKDLDCLIKSLKYNVFNETIELIINVWNKMKQNWTNTNPLIWIDFVDNCRKSLNEHIQKYSYSDMFKLLNEHELYDFSDAMYYNGSNLIAILTYFMYKDLQNILETFCEKLINYNSTI